MPRFRRAAARRARSTLPSNEDMVVASMIKMNGKPILLHIDGPAYVKGDACGYKLESVDIDGTCHLYNDGTCQDRDGTTFCVWPMIRRTAKFADVAPSPHSPSWTDDYGSEDDLARLLEEQVGS
jgi:hypothetical protein